MAKLVSRLRVIADGADEAVSLALHDTADFILQMIRLYVRVDTGWLRDSYQKETLSQLHIIIGTMVMYAWFQEYGKASGRYGFTPHVTPSFVLGEQFFRNAFIRRMNDLG